MRNFQRFKVIQLLVSVIAAAGSMSYLFFSGVISQGLLSQPAILILSLLVWLLSLLSFIYILVDARLLRNMTAEYAGLETMTYRDELTGLPNRASCDLFLKQALEDDTFDHISFVLLRFNWIICRIRMRRTAMRPEMHFSCTLQRSYPKLDRLMVRLCAIHLLRSV